MHSKLKSCVFSEYFLNLYGAESHELGLLASSRLGPIPSFVVCNHLPRCRIPELSVGVSPREGLRLIKET
jgi:hypothetical protein